MSLLSRGTLALYAYTEPGSTLYSQAVADYSAQVEALEFTTVAPGGFGDLAALVKLSNPRLQRSELQPFSRVSLTDGSFCAFSGEWSDPVLALDGAHGEYVLLSALGGGVALRDDPDDSGYTSQTAQAIIAAEFNKRAAYLALDADQSLVLPAAPATTFSPAYDGFNLEEILHDLAFALGDYTWCVYDHWDHAQHKDAAGFPTWQLQMHPRDTTTTSYMAFAEDITSWRVTPSTQRAYNVVQVAYIDQSGNPQVVSVQDSRLTAGGGRGTAPFRRRKLRRALPRVPLSAAQATTLANAWLAAYSTLTNKVEIELASVRDANGLPIPLHRVRADANLFVPELAVRGTTLSSSPAPGVNQFYIVETRYSERAEPGSHGAPRLWLALDNYADLAGGLLAQLRLAYDAQLRARGSARQVISPGVALAGPCGATLTNQSAGGTVRVVVPFGVTLARAPTSVSLSAISASNASGISASAPAQTGFTLSWTVPAAGATSVQATYTTVGN